MTPEEMDRLTSRIESRLQRAWRAMLRQIRDDFSLAEVEAFVRGNNLELLAQSVEAAAEKFASEVAAGYVQSGQTTARWLDDSVDAMVRFNMTNEQAVAWMEQQTSEFVRGMVAEQREVANRVIASARARGVGERAVAQEVIDSLGLNSQQLDYVESYRRALSTGDYSNLLDRQLGDARFDRALVNADEAGAFIAPERQEAMVARYRDNWVVRRGENIARGEAFMAAHAGQQEAIGQAVAGKDIAASRLTQIWHTRGDAKVRHSHRTMSGQKRKFGKPFRSGFGNLLRFPHDPDAPLSETVNCRCVVEVKLAGAKARKFRHDDDGVLDVAVIGAAF